MMDIKNANANISRLLKYLSILISKDPNMSNQARAYLDASKNISKFKINLCDFEDEDDLTKLPSIGNIIAKDIIEYCQTGGYRYLEKVLLTSDPIDILQLAKGVDRRKAEHLSESLAAFSFNDLLKDYESGRLKLYIEKNSKDYNNITELLNFLPSWKNRKKREFLLLKDSRPSTAELLRLDRHFSQRFSFEKIKFKEITLNYRKGKINICYSNSKNANRFDAVGDWVNISYKKNDHKLDWVILTSRYGKLKGKRIVMGEVKECQEYYSKFELPLEDKEQPYFIG